MKSLYIAFTVLMSSHAMAAQECSSQWIFHPETVIIPAGKPTVVDTGGGHNLNAVCDGERAKFDSQTNGSVTRGVIVDQKELPQTDKRSSIGNILISVTYHYQCTIEAVSYNIGANATWGAAPGTTASADLPTNARCLSCDGIDDAKKTLECLSESVDAIDQKAVTLQPADIKAIQSTTQDLIDAQATAKVFSSYQEIKELVNVQKRIEALGAQ